MILRQPPPHFARVQDYLHLCKPRITLLIVFTALVGMFMATPGMAPWSIVIAASLGIGLAAASAAAVNHIVDLRIDSLMARTLGRPLPRGRVEVREAICFAVLLAALSALILGFLVNVLTAALTLLSLIGYGFVYSMFLKRRTPQNIVIGGVTGAVPPLLGWCAVSGVVEPHALLLCLIIFTWTPPHFWSLAICRREEYAAANVPMLPVTHGVALTRLHILLYTIALTLVCLLPWLTRMSGLIYLAGAAALNAGFLYHAIRMHFDHSDRQAARTFDYSIQHLFLLFAVLLVDHHFLILL